MADTILRGAIDLLENIGLFDIVLPFLLVFTIVFAILEKTKVFGSEEIDGKKYPKKNLNATAAFVMAFLVIASSRLVEVITTVSANTVILLLLSILFLLLIGSFFKEGEAVHLAGGWKTLFMVIMFIGIVLIFLNALGWLGDITGYFGGTNNADALGAIILLIVVIWFVAWVVRAPNKRTKSKS